MNSRMCVCSAAMALLAACSNHDSPSSATGSPRLTTSKHSSLGLAPAIAYTKATGCNAPQYNQALQVALDYTLFRDVLDDDLLSDAGYARRHSRGFFGPLLEGKSGNGCLTPELHQLAMDLAYQVEHSKIREPDTGSVPGTIQLRTRSAYMAATGCLVSPSTWQKYRIGLYATVLGMDDSSSETPHLKQFLQELGEGRRTEDNFLDPACLDDGLKAVASMAGVLDTAGRFILE